ncbi:YlxR family protein [Acidipropionibacterium virtanenii]|uniref:YlxR family protein n=1 Tax=Acidipropionibacterium virtanenii TaxID=2057246 RepID=UPI003CCC798B
MVRFVLDGDHVVLDPGSRAPGRGAHLHPDAECWRAALRGGFARSFRRRVTAVPPGVDWLPEPENWA